MMKVLLTGGSGFIGKPVEEALLSRGCQLLSLSRQPVSQQANITRLTADLGAPATYLDAITEFRPEILVHLAWQDIPNFSLAKSQQNLFQSQIFIEHVLGIGSCRNVVVSGSCFETSVRQGMVMESDQGMSRDHFTWAKNSLRNWLEMECKKKNIGWSWLRIFYAYGPGQRSASLLPTLIRHIADGTVPPISTPLNENDFVFVRDLGEAFADAATKDHGSGIFNLGSGTATSILDICRMTEMLLKGSEELSNKLRDNMTQKQCDVSFWADTTGSYKVLGWTPRTSLEQGIRETITSILEQG